MQQFKNTLLSIFTLLSVIIISSTALSAHFGSKGPFGGSVSVAISYDTTVYLGTFNGGVYRSNNASLSAWTAMPVGLRSGKITALTHSGSDLFAGTLDAGIYIFNGYVGTDRHWIKINTGLSNLHIKSLVALDSITLLAGTDGGGLYKTTNKGAGWTAVNNTSLNNKTITALTKAGSRIVLTTLDGGVFMSNDNGSTWTGFNDTHTLNIGGTSFLSYNAATDQLAVINNNGLFVTDNAGTTTTPNYVSVQTGLPAGIALRSVNNNGTSWYLATDQGVFVFLLGSWVQSNSGLPTTDITVVLPFKTDLVAGTWKEGIFKSPEAGISWVRRNTNFNNLETYAMETSGDKVVVVATEKGVFVSKDLAASYVLANTGLADSLNVTYLKFSGTKLYASTKNAGMFVSADTGKTWIALNNGLTTMNVKKIFASATDLYIVDTGNDLLQYINSGWISIKTGLPGNTVPASITFYGSKMLLGTWGQGAFTREVANGVWSTANTGLSNLNVTSVTANGTHLFAGTDGAGVFVSNADLINWSPAAPVTIAHTVKMGLDGTKIQDMAYNAGYIFASYKGGLLATSDNGLSWIAGGNQFNLPSYTDVNRISFVTTRVFVSTENNSVYSNALSELPVITAVNDMNDALNAVVSISPNPNHGSFVIRVSDDSNAKVEGVSIMDNSGKLIRNITGIDGVQSVPVNTTFTAGIYFVQIRTNEGIAVKKIVIE